MSPALTRKRHLDTLLHPGHRPRDTRRHSRFVAIMRVVLPVLAGVLFAVLAMWPYVKDLRQAVLQSEVSGNLDLPENPMQMSNPHYTGTDDRGRKFSITADSAYPDGIDPTEVELVSLVATMIDQGGRRMKLTAAEGMYYPKREVLDLSGGVTVTSEDGYRVESPEATVDLAAGTIDGPSPMAAEGPLGTLRANTFKASDDDKTMRFDGEVRLVITPGGSEKQKQDQEQEGTP